MSADNGVYILKTPARPIKHGAVYENRHGVFEYRIAYCTAIDNLDYCDLYVPAYFSDSRVWENPEEARDAAFHIAVDIANRGIYLEYGVGEIEKHFFFPNMTSEQARKALDSYIDPL